MKATVSIYKGSELVASKTVNSKKELNQFTSANIPQMKMTQWVSEKWSIISK